MRIFSRNELETTPPAQKPGVFFMRIALALSIISAIAGGPAMGQEGRPRNTLTLDAINGFKGMNSFEYQRVTDSGLAIVARGVYWSLTESKWNIEAAGVGGGIRLYTNKEAPVGGYVGLGLDVANVTASMIVFAPGESQSAIFIMPMATAGYSWIVEGVYMELVFGGRYNAGNIQPVIGQEFPMKGPGFSFTVNIGLPF